MPAAYERLASDLGPGGIGADMDELDGITFSLGGSDWWWANIRPSNTEPLLRLNVEASNEELMAEVRDRALALIRV